MSAESDQPGASLQGPNLPDPDSGKQQIGEQSIGERPAVKSQDEIVRVAPSAQLSRGQLIAVLLLMIGVGLGVYSFFPESVGGPPLPVAVELGRAPVDTVSGGLAVMTDVVRVTSRLDAPIDHLAIEINGQYLLMQASPLSAGETLVLPLGVFTDKRSSKRFDPKRQEVHEVIVRGQLPSRSRGVSKFEFAD